MAAPSGVLFPMPRLGSPITSGLQAFFYAPGTTTKQNSYTTSALSVANSNPLVADANGLFSAVYLDPALGYKVVIAPSTDTDPPTSPIYSQDNAYLPAASYFFPQVNQFRLTLTSATPVTNTDVSAATTLYAALYGGNRIALYSSTKSAWELFTSAEMSITLVGLTASTPYDVFVYNNSGTPTLELTAWTNTTTRATALALQDGVYVKSGTTTRRYLGTVYINGSGGQTDDALAKRYVWNYYNRVARPIRVQDSTNSWTYTTATLRQARATTSNQVDVVIGVEEEGVSATVIGQFSNTSAGVEAAVAIGLDSTSAGASGGGCANAYSPVANYYVQTVASYVLYTGIGKHSLVWLEISAATGTTTWGGTRSAWTTGQANGIFGIVRG